MFNWVSTLSYKADIAIFSSKQWQKIQTKTTLQPSLLLHYPHLFRLYRSSTLQGMTAAFHEMAKHQDTSASLISANKGRDGLLDILVYWWHRSKWWPLAARVAKAACAALASSIHSKQAFCHSGQLSMNKHLRWVHRFFSAFLICFTTCKLDTCYM